MNKHKKWLRERYEQTYMLAVELGSLNSLVGGFTDAQLDAIRRARILVETAQDILSDTQKST